MAKKSINPEIFALLMGFMGLTALMAGGMHIPMFPEMAEEFGTTATVMKLTISVTFGGAALGQLIAGPFSDVFGKKTVLIIFTCIFILGSLACSMVEDIHMFLFARFLQGIGIAGAPPIVRALVSEDFKGKIYYKVMALVLLLFALAPGIAPLLGSFIGHHFDWRAIFYTLTGLAIVSLIIAAGYDYEAGGSQSKIKRVYKESWNIIKNNDFMGYTVINMISFSQLFIFASLSSYLFRIVYGWSLQEFAWVGLALVLGSGGGSLLTRFLVAHVEPRTILPWGVGIMLAASFFLFGISLVHEGTGRLVLIAVIIYFMGSGVVCSISTGHALNAIKRYKGAASGVIGVSAVFAIFAGTGLVSLLDDNLLNISLVLLAAPLVCGALAITLSSEENG